MQRSTIDYLLKFFKELIQSQKALKCIKNELNAIKRYHPLLIFNRIAKEDEAITIISMKEYLKERMAVNERELYEIFEKFDHKRQGRIDREDFCRELRASDKKEKRSSGGTKVTYEMQCKFIEYISTIIKSCRVIDVWRKELMKVEPYVIFAGLDSNMDGRIGPFQLFRFFLMNEERMTKENSMLLFKILMKRHYKEVNLEVFCQNLSCSQLTFYQAYKRQQQRNTKTLLKQKQQRCSQAVEQQNYYKKRLKDEKIIQLVHHEASLLREQQLQNRIKNERQIYQQLKYKTLKKYHPQLTYSAFLTAEKENIERSNLQRQLLQQQAIRKELHYQDTLIHAEVARDLDNLQRAKKSKLPYATMQNKTESVFHSKGSRQLQHQIRKYHLGHLNYQHSITNQRRLLGEPYLRVAQQQEDQPDHRGDPGDAVPQGRGGQLHGHALNKEAPICLLPDKRVYLTDSLTQAQK